MFPRAEAFTIPFTGPRLISKCNEFSISPDPPPDQTISGYVVENSYLRLEDSVAGGAAKPTKFVLFSPEVTVRVMGGVMALLRDNRVPCGFAAEDALGYRQVFVVGPADDELVSFLQAVEIDVDTSAPHDKAATLRAFLEAKLT
jgi:hypothetical protein